MDMVAALEKCRQDLEDGKLDAVYEKYIAKREAKNKMYENFFATEFPAKFELLKTYLVETNTMVNDHDFSYGDLTFITCEEFWNIFEVIHRFTDTKLVDDSSAMFSTSGFIYNGVIFEIMSGQGTILRAILADENQTTYPLHPEFIICSGETGITGVYRFGELIAKDLSNPAELLQLLGYSASIVNIESSDDLLPKLEGYDDSDN